MRTSNVIPPPPTPPSSTFKSPQYQWGDCVFVFEVKAGTFNAPPRDLQLEKYRLKHPLSTPIDVRSKEPSDPPHQVQAARYGMGPTSTLAPIRRFTLVALIEGYFMRLLYVDHSCILISRPCNYIEEPSYFVSLLLAITKCGSHALGFEPAFVDDDDYPRDVQALQVNGMRYALSDDYILDAGNDLLESDDETGDQNSVDGWLGTQVLQSLTLPLESVDVVTSGRNLKARPPLVSATEEYDPSNIPRLPPNPTMLPPRDLTGRGSSVYHANATILKGDGNTTTLPCVTKFAWQPTRRVYEANLYHIANRKNIANIAQLIASHTLAMLSEEGSTRTRLVHKCFSNQLDPAFDNRILTAISITPRCIPLAEVTDIRSFISAFLSLMTGTPFSRSKSGDRDPYINMIIPHSASSLAREGQNLTSRHLSRKSDGRYFGQLTRHPHRPRSRNPR